MRPQAIRSPPHRTIAGKSETLQARDALPPESHHRIRRKTEAPPDYTQHPPQITLLCNKSPWRFVMWPPGHAAASLFAAA